jgi:ribonuclease HIII
MNKSVKNLSLLLNDKEIAMLSAALIEMHHKIVSTEQYEHLEKEAKEKVKILRHLWYEVCEQCQIP